MFEKWTKKLIPPNIFFQILEVILRIWFPLCGDLVWKRAKISFKVAVGRRKKADVFHKSGFEDILAGGSRCWWIFYTFYWSCRRQQWQRHIQRLSNKLFTEYFTLLYLLFPSRRWKDTRKSLNQIVNDENLRVFFAVKMFSQNLYEPSFCELTLHDNFSWSLLTSRIVSTFDFTSFSVDEINVNVLHLQGICLGFSFPLFLFSYYFMFWFRSVRSTSTLCICKELAFLLPPRSLFRGCDHIGPVSDSGFVEPFEWSFLCNQIPSSFVDTLASSFLAFSSPLSSFDHYFELCNKCDLVDLLSAGTPGKS